MYLNLKMLLAGAGVFVELLNGIVYYTDIFRGKTKPHLYTFLIWGIVISIAFAGQLVSGAGPGAWVTGMSALIALGVVPLCFWFGTKDIARFDTIILAAALFAIVPWIITKDPLWSVILATIIDALAILPTIRKTWNAPHSESLLAWNLASIKLLLGISALSTFSLMTWVYPAQAFVMNSILIGVILYRRKTVGNY